MADSHPGADYVQQFAFIIATSQSDLAIRSKALGFVSGDRLEAASVGLLADLARDGQRENALRLLASLPDAVAGKAASAFGASLVINRNANALDLTARFGQGDIRADETVRGIARGMTMLEGTADEYRARLAEALWEHGKSDRLIGSVVVPVICEKERAEGGSASAVAVISTQISALPESVRRDLWLVLIQSTSDDPHEVSELINGSRLDGDAGSEMLQQAVEMIISNGNNIEGGIKFTSWLTDPRDRKMSAFQAGSLCAPRIDSVEEAKNFMRLLGEDQVGSFIDGLTKQKKFRSGVPIEREELR